jgi:hypothetical protein
LRQKQQTSESSSLKQSTSTLSLRNFLKHLETSGERQNGKPLYLSALRPCPDLGGSVHVTRIWHAIDKKKCKTCENVHAIHVLANPRLAV